MRELSAKLTEGEIQRANEPHSTFSYYREILSRLRRERINYISRQKDFAFCGARPKALSLETANFLKKVGSKAFSDSFHVTRLFRGLKNRTRACRAANAPAFRRALHLRL